MSYRFVSIEPSGNGTDFILAVERRPNVWQRLLGEHRRHCRILRSPPQLGHDGRSAGSPGGGAQCSSNSGNRICPGAAIGDAAQRGRRSSRPRMTAQTDCREPATERRKKPPPTFRPRPLACENRCLPRSAAACSAARIEWFLKRGDAALLSAVARRRARPRTSATWTGSTCRRLAKCLDGCRSWAFRVQFENCKALRSLPTARVQSFSTLSTERPSVRRLRRTTCPPGCAGRSLAGNAGRVDRRPLPVGPTFRGVGLARWAFRRGPPVRLRKRPTKPGRCPRRGAVRRTSRCWVPL